MNNKRIVLTGLALASLIIINNAFADEVVVTEARDEVIAKADDVRRDRAAQANAAAAQKAVAAVLADTKLDLDIRLIGPTSVKVAGKR